MGRPRKQFNRLTRTITARVQDEQYDWLVARAIDEDGDMSKAIRDAIDSARIFTGLLESKDPIGDFARMLERSKDVVDGDETRSPR